VCDGLIMATAHACKTTHSAISSTFHNDVEKQNPYRLKYDVDAGVAFVSSVQYVISIKGYGGHILDTERF